MANKKTDTNFKKDSNSFKKNEQKKKKRIIYFTEEIQMVNEYFTRYSKNKVNA